MKTLRCRDVGFDCDQVIHGETDEAILAQAAEHAQQVHHVTVTPELAVQVKGLIKEDAGESPAFTEKTV